MRIFASEGSARRVAAALAGHELIVADGKGGVHAGGRAIDPRDARPEIVWLTFDALMGGGADLFFDTALGGSVKWLHTQQTGLDSPRYRDVVARGVMLTNSHAQAPAIADYVLANVLAETWPVAAARAAQAAGEWRRMPFRELSQCHWLIVGMGAIGREIAVRARGFGGRITAVNRTGRADAAADAAATLGDLPALLPTADIVVLAAARTAATTDLVDDAFVAALKPGSILVNIARGELVVDAALLAGLDRGRPGLAILDAFREEPLPRSHPYWRHPRVRVTAHTSSAGDGTPGRADDFFLENLGRYQRGAALLSRVGADSF